MAAGRTAWTQGGPPAGPISLAAFAPGAAVKSLGILSQGFDERAAMDLVVYMDQFWRNAGNAGYNASLDRIRARLQQSGFSDRGDSAAPAAGPHTWIEEYGKAQGWDYTVGTLTLLGGERGKDEVLLSREQQRVALCINSFSTPGGGIEAPLWTWAKAPKRIMPIWKSRAWWFLEIPALAACGRLRSCGAGRSE